MRSSCGGRALILRKSPEISFRWSFGQKKSYGDHTALALSPHHLRTASVRSPHERRVISVRNLRRLSGNCTLAPHVSVRSPHSLLTALLGLLPSDHTKIRTMPVHCVNAYSVARTHLRCPPPPGRKKKKKRRPIYRTAPEANVNWA